MKLSKKITDLIINKILTTGTGGDFIDDIIDSIEPEDCPIELLEVASTLKGMNILATIARHPKTPSHILPKLIKHTDWKIRRDAAKNPNLGSEFLLELASDGDYDVVKAITDNPNITPEILEKISRKRNDDCKEMVAEHHLTPIHVLEKLSRAEGNYTRRYVGANPNTPIKILTKLAKDSNSSVVTSAMCNPNIPFDLILKHREIYGDGYYTTQMLKHKDCTAEILEAMHMDLNFEMRELIAVHPNTPMKILDKYARYKSHGVRNFVQSNPKCPPALRLVLSEYINHEHLNDLVDMYKLGAKAKDIKEFVDIENTFEDLLS